MFYRLFFAFILSAIVGINTAFAQADSSGLNYDSVLVKVLANQVPYTTLSMRAKLNWDDGNGQQDFQASIRMKKDSVVWMSLTGAFGVEGARVLITPDSFRLINKMAGEYAVRDYNFVSNWLMFPLGFKMLQQLIAGNKIDIPQRATMLGREDSSTLVLYSESEKILEKIWVSSQNYTIEKIVLKDKLLKQELTVNFEAYNMLNNKPFPHQRNIVVNRDGLTMKLSIDITKVRQDEDLAYPFELSDKLKRID